MTAKDESTISCSYLVAETNVLEGWKYVSVSVTTTKLFGRRVLTIVIQIGWLNPPFDLFKELFWQLKVAKRLHVIYTNPRACLKKVVHLEMHHFDLYLFYIFHSLLYDLQDY